ncbi:hypothetical protein BFS06_11540 [Clostridium perfringens]|uniref:Putative N-methyltransferase n=2 Tax=Clostridium perfringens TaxID=1502 RepID=A0A140GS15_CLOPF|nr:hypothetical protein [Clostridium perfringens]AMN31324.1 putative N-methyltransferase [Clostridium perfringens]TBX14847.1 hypothetical protein BFS06_11540 [Clostridium perfringens]
MEFIIKSENTAINIGISNSTKLILESYKGGGYNVLDYGAGKLRNSKALINNGFIVDILETPNQLKKISKENLKLFNSIISCDSKDMVKFIRKYNIVLCSFVINVIVSLDERIDVLNSISDFLFDNGLAYIEVRGFKSILASKNKQKYGDGYILGMGYTRTFQKPFSIDEFKSLIEESKLEIVDIKKYSDSFVAICKKGV